MTNQSHFTLAFPLKSPADAKALAEQLPPMMPGLFQAEDTIGTIHYSRFTVLSEKTLLFLGDFDGEFGQLMGELAKHAGPVFDFIFQHVDNPPPTPVADHADAFVDWTEKHLLAPVNLYTAYPGATAKEIKALASAAGLSGAGVLNPFLVILPIKSALAFTEVKLLLRARGRGTTHDLDKVGTPHFAQFVPLEDHQVGFFTVYDGTFDTYIADFTKNIGEVFDLIFKFCINPPPSPCRKYLQEFIDFAAGANRTPIGFYQAYPGLGVQDIHALIADSKTAVGAALTSAFTRGSSGDQRQESMVRRVVLSQAGHAWPREGGTGDMPVRIRRRAHSTWVIFKGSSCAGTGCPWSGISCLRWAFLPRHASCSGGWSVETSQTRRRSPLQKTGT